MQTCLLANIRARVQSQLFFNTGYLLLLLFLCSKRIEEGVCLVCIIEIERVPGIYSVLYVTAQN